LPDWHAAPHVTPEKPSDPFATLLPLIDALRKELPIDGTRLYGTGLSMGGYGTWDLITRLPDTFAAAVPICGGGDESKATAMAKVAQWIFHGGADTVVEEALNLGAIPPRMTARSSAC
jgi:predicted peptidase